jgi:hypothetical protein
VEQRIYYQEWRDEQAGSKYPFADGASLTADTGLVLDPAIFLDAVLYPIGGGPRLFLVRVTARGTRTVTIVVGTQTGAELASAEFDPLEPPSELPVFDPLGRPAGLIVSTPERLAAFQTWPFGDHTFGPNAEFVSSCVVPMPAPGLRGLMLEDGELFNGDVWIVGEDGVVVRQDGEGVIRIDLVGDPLFRRRLCEPNDLFATPRFIKTINGIAPDERGTFLITVNSELAGDTILRLYPTDDGRALRFEVVGQKLEGVT